MTTDSITKQVPASYAENFIQYKTDCAIISRTYFLLKGYLMKKLFFVLFGVLTITACSQPKDIYFNGAEGSRSGLKYDQNSRSFGLNTN